MTKSEGADKKVGDVCCSGNILSCHPASVMLQNLGDQEIELPGTN